MSSRLVEFPAFSDTETATCPVGVEVSCATEATPGDTSGGGEAVETTGVEDMDECGIRPSRKQPWRREGLLTAKAASTSCLHNGQV